MHASAPRALHGRAWAVRSSCAVYHDCREVVLATDGALCFGEARPLAHGLVAADALGEVALHIAARTCQRYNAVASAVKRMRRPAARIGACGKAIHIAT